MPLVLYYMAPSPPARSVDLAIHALNIRDVKYEVINLFKRQHRSPEYLQVNPAHTIPAIDDDGFILGDSRAIMAYLVSKFGKDDSLYPKDLDKRAIVDQRLHFTNEMFMHTKNVTKSLIFFNGTTVPEDSRAAIEDVQESLERILKESDFLAGDHLTIADLSLITFIDIIQIFSPPENKFPLTQKWIAKCEASIKDFEKVNKEGSSTLVALVKEKLEKL